MIEEKLFDAKELVRTYLKPIEVVSADDAKEIIARYAAAVEGNFTSWMGAALIYARTPQGEFAAKENLVVEIKDDHPGMLREFARQAQAEPSLVHYKKVNQSVSSMRRFIGMGNGLEALTVMATLENTSAVFVPYLAALAIKRDSMDLQYTDVHGVADINHAKQFIWAVEYEGREQDNAVRKIDFAISKTMEYLKAIFT